MLDVNRQPALRKDLGTALALGRGYKLAEARAHALLSFLHLSQGSASWLIAYQNLREKMHVYEGATECVHSYRCEGVYAWAKEDVRCLLSLSALFLSDSFSH